jgi:hypothetical protein
VVVGAAIIFFVGLMLLAFALRRHRRRLDSEKTVHPQGVDSLMWPAHAVVTAPGSLWWESEDKKLGMLGGASGVADSAGLANSNVDDNGSFGGNTMQRYYPAGGNVIANPVYVASDSPPKSPQPRRPTPQGESVGGGDSSYVTVKPAVGRLSMVEAGSEATKRKFRDPNRLAKDEGEEPELYRVLRPIHRQVETTVKVGAALNSSRMQHQRRQTGKMTQAVARWQHAVSAIILQNRMQARKAHK